MDLTSRATTFALPRFGRLVLAALLIIAIAALALLAVGSRSQRIPAPFGPAANGLMLSWSADGDILATNADGTNPRPIVADASFDFAPWFSHDGTRFLFWRRISDSESEVMVANADGSEVRSLSGGPLTDADWYEWSPADDQVAVVHARNLQRVITILDAKGSAPPRDIDLGDLDVDNNVYWRPPAGDQLIFSARQTMADDSSALYAVNQDGTSLRMLRPLRKEHYYDLALAPDGKRLAYTNIEADASGNGYGWHIHFHDIDSGADRKVTFDPRASREIDEHGPQFSPDGSQLLLWTQDGDLAQLAVAPSDGSAHARPLGLEFNWNSDYNYTFSPDGKTAMLNLGISTTWLIDIASGERRVTDEPVRNFATWQRLALPIP